MIVTSLRPKIKRERDPDRIINAARARYHRLPLTSRPALHQPSNALGLFSDLELFLLFRAHRWPLTAEDQRFIAGQRPKQDYRVIAARVAVEGP